MVLCEAAFRVCGERGPPELGLEAGGVDGVGHAAHAVGADAVVGLPVAFANLVAVIYVDPFESEFDDLGEGADDFVHRELAFVAPGAPDGLVGVGR